MPSRKSMRLGRAITISKLNKWQEIIAEVTVILMLCIQPLYFNKQRYVGLAGHKYKFFFICMCAVLCVSALVIIVRAIGGFKLVSFKELAVYDFAVLGFALVTVLSALLSPYKGTVDVWNGLPERHDGVITQLFYVAIFLIVARWYKPRERDFVFFGISASCIGLIGIFQFYGFDFFKLWPNEPGSMYYVEDFYSIFFRSTLGNINIVSTYVCVAVLVCGFLFIRTDSRLRYIWLAGGGFSFWLMFLAGSDSGMVGTLVTFVLAIPFIVESRKHLGRFFILASSFLAVLTLQRLFYNLMILKTETVGRIILYTVVAVVLCAAGFMLSLPANEKNGRKLMNKKWGLFLTAAVIAVGFAGIEVLGRRGEDAWRPVYQAREMMHGSFQDDFGSGRIGIWKNGLEAFTENPVIGSGPDTFWEVYPAREEQLEATREKMDKAHNEYLQILVCQGILGLLFYLTFLGTLLYKVVPVTFKEPLLMAAAAGFTGYCIQAFFNISMPISSQMLWVLAGVMACYAKKEVKQKTAKNSANESR
ncbi:MAG: O-antigen ligase family protein [Oscillospiraceae bacterium]|nr:O-antigen ligase family protein [Oscillospiraceae bacterium]